MVSLTHTHTHTHLREEVWVANDNQESLRSADGHVESLGVAKETEVVSEVRGHQIRC